MTKANVHGGIMPGAVAVQRPQDVSIQKRMVDRWVFLVKSGWWEGAFQVGEQALLRDKDSLVADTVCPFL